MADNYLEQRMEDLRNGRLAADNRRLASKKSSGVKAARLQGLRVVVTGGAGLIGSEIVRSFRKEGASVDILDIDRKRGSLVAQATGACFHPVDISDMDAFRAEIYGILESRGDIDVIVNCAAYVDFVDITENSAERMMTSFNVNVLPAFEGARMLACHRKAVDKPNPYGGSIINICSTRAIQSESSTENYSASKGALRSLTHSLMMSLAPYGVTVNSISPGWISSPEDEHTEADMLQHPSRRVGKPSDIARMCVYISMPGNDFLNGEDIIIDGGMTRRMIYV